MLRLHFANQSTTLGSGFLESARTWRDRPALEVAGSVLTYLMLLGQAESLAATLDQYQTEAPGRL